MIRKSAFFKKKDFYFEYQGYYIEEKGKKLYPIILYFRENELVINYKNTPIFSFLILPGEQNQSELSKKIEHYWKIGIWKPKYEEGLIINRETLLLSPFPLLYGFKVGKDSSEKYIFEKCILFEEKGYLKVREIKNEGKELILHSEKDEWKWENGVIKASKISLRLILVDFLFEIEMNQENSIFAEDRNFLKIQPILKDNKVIDALTRKIIYLWWLQKEKEQKEEKKEQKEKQNKLSSPFLNAEKRWLDVCFLEKYSEVFSSSSSIFDEAEEEVKNVIFKARIGGKSRRQLFEKEDKTTIDHTVTFFLRRYAITDIFGLLLPSWFPSWISARLVFLILLLILLSIPFGDFLLYVIFKKKDLPIYGIFSICIPAAIFLIGIIYYRAREINLFKLCLPRLFLGITLGWLLFLNSDDLWLKMAFFSTSSMIIIVNCIFGLLLFLYLFTEIKNRVSLKSWAILKRTLYVAVFAGVISLLQGFYMIQLFAKPLLEGSEVIDEIISKKVHYSIDSLSKISKRSEIEKNRYTCEEKLQQAFGKYFSLNLFGKKDYCIRYIWSMLLFLFVPAICLGAILQFLWEDKPITEPL